jgi:hypothetical protein
MKLDSIQLALARAGIQIVSTYRVNGCGTNIYLKGGGIYSLYDSGRFLLQGKPTPAEAGVFDALVRESKSKAPVAPKHEMEEWEEWLAARYSERQA